MHTIIYKINVVLLTDVWYLFVCYNTSGWKTLKSNNLNFFASSHSSHNVFREELKKVGLTDL